MDINTFDRFLGNLWIGEYNINELLVEEGLATKEKPK